ncbi:MAG: hypothetical protein K8J31_06365 [Anaerolineae bacterium]|nr:hypothetical protein [Anaerolineae bacterium]
MKLVWSSLMGVLVLASLSLTLSPVPALAQQPTSTPTDPIWLGFSTARDAIEEDRSVDLTLIQSYSFEQAEWKQGIDDGCRTLEEGDFGRRVWFGWNFSITSLRGETFQARVSFDLKDVAVCDQVISSAPAADTSSSALPAPVSGSAAVGGFELGGHVLQLNSNTVSLMNRAGMTWVKKQVEYKLGDDPSKAAGTINEAKANGFKILLGIKGDKAQMGNFDSYIGSFADFLGGVAALGADAIEVWNEPNIDREWPAGSINGGSYTQMLARAFNAIKSRNANTLVVSGAPAPTGFFGAAGCAAGGCNDDVFMQQMAQAGAAQYLDCVGLHYNEGIVPPTQNSADPRGEYPSYYFSSMLARGYNPFGGKPVCFSELGYLSGDGFSTAIPASFGWAANTSVQEHAAWLAGAATAAAQSGHVRLMIVWNVDFPFYTATDPMGGYAMFRPDGTCPACDTLGAVMK